ncbi:hypothetical protein PRZ48_012506 [Zasmidium cellare]|uniref:Amino acid transporter n=1 Tax=Zasmidium cellare TaxID=395010 RepID=A0ABR0E5M5_ZASCE|nr:hypothetical protein PRZ48_012506 [Zasmidium cellare]
MSTYESEPKTVFEDVSIQDLGSGHKSPNGSSGESNDEDVVDDSVPVQYHGTSEDKHDMRVLGKKQVLRRHFSFTSMVGFSSTVLVAWEETPVLAIYALDNGGTAIIFWGIIAAIIGCSAIYMSLAEMASMFPTAGGQYHWVSELAPRRYQKGLSYSVGWLTAMGWQVCLASICFQAGIVTQGLIQLNNPDYVFHNWHGTLLSMAYMVFASVFNTVLATKLPLTEGFMLILHVAGLFAIIIPLWVMAPRGNAHEVLLEFSTTGGWSNLGLACLIGLNNPISLLIGYDCTVHMSEEVKHAATVVPRALLWTIVPNAIMCLVMGTTLIFCLGDIDDVLASPTGQPFIQVFKNATQSNAGTTVMTSIIVIMLVSATISEVATASRQLWAFARDRGLPASTWLARTTPGLNIPLNGVLVTVTISCLLFLINIGSDVALNAIDSLGIVSLLFSYLVTIGCMVWRRLWGPPLPPAPWSLGKWGLAVNVFSLCFLVVPSFFAFWPVDVNPTAEEFNWSPVMFVGILSITAVYYFVKGRHEYEGPVVFVKRHLQ